MRLYQILSEAEIKDLEEISRRGFLKGLGAVAGLAAMGNVGAAPFNHGQNVDPMDNKPSAKTATVKSNDGLAELYIQYNDKSGQDGVWIDVKNGRIDAVTAQSARIKFKDNPIVKISIQADRNSSYKSAQLGSGGTRVPGIGGSKGSDFISTHNLAKYIMTHSGELKVEIPLYQKGNHVYTFEIEQDATSRKIK